MSFSLLVCAPDGVLFSGRVSSVILPGSRGQFEVLAGHAPLVDKLEGGSVVYKTSAGVRSLEVGDGVVEVLDDVVRVVLSRPVEG